MQTPAQKLNSDVATWKALSDALFADGYKDAARKAMSYAVQACEQRDVLLNAMPTPDLKNVKFAATITKENSPEFKESLVVRVTVSGIELDRHDLYGWHLLPKHRKLAERLVRAVEAGVVFTPERVATDVNGNTYLIAPTKVMGRTANADLKRLGF